jgi:NADPH-dependent 7-cyano-7-deazaguanine reductase QueF
VEKLKSALAYKMSFTNPREIKEYIASPLFQKLKEFIAQELFWRS